LPTGGGWISYSESTKVEMQDSRKENTSVLRGHRKQGGREQARTKQHSCFTILGNKGKYTSLKPPKRISLADFSIPREEDIDRKLLLRRPQQSSESWAATTDRDRTELCDGKMLCVHGVATTLAVQAKHSSSCEAQRISGGSDLTGGSLEVSRSVCQTEDGRDDSGMLSHRRSCVKCMQSRRSVPGQRGACGVLCSHGTQKVALSLYEALLSFNSASRLQQAALNRFSG
jgi:hypothetical protein